MEEARLHNKKVKINVENILKDSSRTNSKYQSYIQANRDTIFTAVIYWKSVMVYTFKEDCTWLFYEDDLIEVG